MTINLCLASRLFYPYYAGGALRYKRYLPGLAERDVRVQVVTGTPSKQRAEAFNSENTWEGVPVGELLPITYVNQTPIYRVRLPDQNERRRDWVYGDQVLQFVRSASPQFDLIQFLPLPLWLTPAVLRLRRQKIPLISTYNLFDNNRSSQKFSWQALSRRIPQQLVDLIIVQSTSMRDGLRQLGVKTRIEVIPNGVDLEHFKPAPSQEAKVELRRHLNLPENDVLLLMVGSVEPRKGIDQLLAAWNVIAADCDQVRLIIAGPRPDLENPDYLGFHHELEALLDASAQRERVHFVGEVGNVADYFRAADIFVFSSRREGLPNVVLEAMATALPVVTMPFVGLSEELGEPGEHFWLAERDAGAFGTAVKKLLSNPEHRHRLGKAGHEWVTSQMNLEHILDRYTNLYWEVAHSKQ